MKAVAVYPSQKKIEVISLVEPNISSSSQVKIKMLDVGVCGTDKDIANFYFGTPPLGLDYLVVGHESLGKVVEVGSEVTRVKVGDLAMIRVRRPCHHSDCPSCVMGMQDFCYTGDFTEAGIIRAPGFMAQYVVDEERYVYKVPKNLRKVGVLVEPLTIAQKAIEQVWLIQDRLPWEFRHIKGNKNSPHKNGYQHTAVVLGAGPVGILGAMSLITEEFKTIVYSYELETDPRAQLMKALGITYISSQTCPIEKLVDLIGSIDLVYEACGVPQAAFDMLGVAASNAIVVFTGIPGKLSIQQIDTSSLMKKIVYKNQVILGTVNAGDKAYKNAIKKLGQFYKRWPQVVSGIISQRFDIDSPQLIDLLQGRVKGIKNVVTFKD